MRLLANLLFGVICSFAVAPVFAMDFYGSPTQVSWLGWGLVLAYFATIARCLFKSKRSKKYGGNYVFWLLLAAYLLFFALDKIMGFQDFFTNSARNLTESSGLYEQRQQLQTMFIIFFGAVLGTAALLLRFHLVNSWLRYKVTWAGILLLSIYMVIRATSMHEFDALIAKNIMGVSINAIVQLSLLGLIFFGTFGEQKPVGNRRGLKDRNHMVEISKIGEPVHCPSCGLQPLSNTKDGRTFKCRKCGFSFTVHVVAHTILSA